MKKLSLKELNTTIERNFYADGALGELSRRVATAALSAFIAIPVTAVAAIGYSFYKGDSSALDFFNANATSISTVSALVGYADSLVSDKVRSLGNLNKPEKTQNFSDLESPEFTIQKEKMHSRYGTSVVIAALIAAGMNAKTIYQAENSKKDDTDSKLKSTEIFYTPTQRAKNIPSLKELTV